MEKKISKWKTWHKVLLGLIGGFLLLGVIAVNSDGGKEAQENTNTAPAKIVNTDARDFQIWAKDKDIDISKAINIDDSTDKFIIGGDGNFVNVFYRKNVINEVYGVTIIKSERNDLMAAAEKNLKVFKQIDSDAYNHMLDSIKIIKPSIEHVSDFKNANFNIGIEYYPNADNDVLKLNLNKIK